MAPFYTSKGDSGDTGFLGEGRILKSSLRIEAIGCVDEVSAALGLARALTKSEKTCAILLQIQKQLYVLMTELSAIPDEKDHFGKIKKADVNWLETHIKNLEASVTLPRDFIIPGETPGSGALALTRTIIRRAERRIVAFLMECQQQRPILLAYINRLSSLIFVLEVVESKLDNGKIRLAKDKGA